MQAFPRDEIAQLSGDRWLEFLDRSGNTQDFSQGEGQLLPQLAYQSSSALTNLSQQRINNLIISIRQWIKNHQDKDYIQ